MSAVGPQFHEFIKKLEENNDKLPTSITSRTFQPEFEFNNSTCYLCNGYYGPSFGEPVCVTCHAFLYPDIPSNMPSSYIFSETDDGDSGNDEPSELLYNDRRLTRALQLGLAPTWAFRHENSLDSETSPEDEASRPNTGPVGRGSGIMVQIRGFGYGRSRNQGRGLGGSPRDYGLGSAGPSRYNGPTRDHGMGPPGPGPSKDSSDSARDHGLGLAGQSKDNGPTRDQGMGPLGPGPSRDINDPARDHGMDPSGSSSSRDINDPARDHSLGIPGQSRDNGPSDLVSSRDNGPPRCNEGPRDQSQPGPNDGTSGDGMNLPGPSRDVSRSAGPSRDHREPSLDPESRDNATGPTGSQRDHGGQPTPAAENVVVPAVNVVAGANPIDNEEQAEPPLPPWSVARTLAALSTPRLPDNLAPGLVERLPSEVVLCMFSYLDDLSLCACALVCARWCRLVRARVSQARWQDYARRRWPLLRSMVNVQDWHKKYQSLVESCFCRHCLVQMCVLWQPPYEENAWRRNRLRNELKMLRNDPPEGCAATPLDPKCCHWQATVTGPVGSPYEGGVFYLYIQVPYSYPMSPPVVRFLTRILHPNVSRHGDVGIDSVHHNWSLALTLSKVLISIQSLLTDPYTAVCMEPAVGEMYVQDRVRFERIARRWTWRYAMHDVLANS